MELNLSGEITSTGTPRDISLKRVCITSPCLTNLKLKNYAITPLTVFIWPVIPGYALLRGVLVYTQPAIVHNFEILMKSYIKRNNMMTMKGE